MTTDATTGQSIFSHHTSLHSRNRRPFALSDNRKVSSKQTATSVTTIAVGNLNDDLDDATVAENGYATGNARYLHLQIENNGTDDTLELYAYNYAFGSWAKLYLPHGSKVQADTNLEANTTNDRYVEAKWTTINGKFMVTIPIHGIDRIAFVNDGTLNDMVVRAACSTF